MNAMVVFSSQENSLGVFLNSAFHVLTSDPRYSTNQYLKFCF